MMLPEWSSPLLTEAVGAAQPTRYGPANFFLGARAKTPAAYVAAKGSAALHGEEIHYPKENTHFWGRFEVASVMEVGANCKGRANYIARPKVYNHSTDCKLLK